MDKRREKGSMTIALRFMISSALSVLIAVVVMSLLFTLFLNSRFRDYIRQEKLDVRNELVRTLSARLQESLTIDHEWLEELSSIYMDQGLFITLNNAEGDLMWTCMDEENCSMHLNENDPEFFSSLETSSYTLTGRPDGISSLSLSISYEPGVSFSENDRFFLHASFRMLLISMIVALLTSSLASLGFARSLSRPLRTLSAYARRLAGHDYAAGDDYRRGTKEIDRLHDSIDRLARSLASQEELRRRLTADVSHELRTPLTKMQTTMEAMIDGVWPADTEHLRICHSEILRLTGLVSRLDNLNRYDRGHEKIRGERVNLKESLHQAAELFREEFRKRNVRFEADLRDSWVTGDGEKLMQVWINLLSNALKFTDGGGLVRITLVPGDPAEIRFADTGIGMEPSDLPLIFERFYKADSSRNAGGTGLGLSIVKEIVTLHGGTAEALSTPGSGTQIIIRIPQEKKQPPRG